MENLTSATDYFGNIYQVGDTIEFQVLIAFRKHRSRSKVYRITQDHIFVSCNGIREKFKLKHGEVIRVINQL